MKKDLDLTAVSVGYSFGLVPSDALDSILLEDSGAVRFEGENWNLFRAKTYDDSRKLDTLLDQYGEYPLKDYRIEPIIMSGTLQLRVPGFDKERDSLMFESYAVTHEGKSIPFDFSGIAFSIQQEGDTLIVPFRTGKTDFLTDYFLDDCYEDDYKAAGLRIQDITAEFLSKATDLSEFMVSMELKGTEYDPEDICRLGDFTLKSLTFENADKRYPVPQETLARFNTRLAELSRSSLQQKIQSARDKSGERKPDPRPEDRSEPER